MAKPRVQRHRIAANEPIDVPVGVYCESKSRVWLRSRRVVDSVATQGSQGVSSTCVNRFGLTISISTIYLDDLSLCDLYLYYFYLHDFYLHDFYLYYFYLHHFYLHNFYLYDLYFYNPCLSSINSRSFLTQFQSHFSYVIPRISTDPTRLR